MVWFQGIPLSWNCDLSPLLWLGNLFVFISATKHITADFTGNAECCDVAEGAKTDIFYARKHKAL